MHAGRGSMAGFAALLLSGADVLYQKCIAILDRELGEVHVSLFCRERSWFPALGPESFVACVTFLDGVSQTSRYMSDAMQTHESFTALVTVMHKQRGLGSVALRLRCVRQHPQRMRALIQPGSTSNTVTGPAHFGLARPQSSANLHPQRSWEATLLSLLDRQHHAEQFQKCWLLTVARAARLYSTLACT